MKVEAKNVTPPGPVHGIRAKQIRGVPDAPVIQLYPVKMTDSVQLAVNQLGLVAGFMVEADAVLSMAPVRLPPMATARLLGCVEYTGIGDKDAMFSLHWIFINAAGGAFEQYSKPLAVGENGGVFRFDIPLKIVAKDTAYTCALKVVLMDREQPMLIRSAWLEALGG